MDFLLTNLKSQKFRESGENFQEGLGAALAALLARCTIVPLCNKIIEKRHCLIFSSLFSLAHG